MDTNFQLTDSMLPLGFPTQKNRAFVLAILSFPISSILPIQETSQKKRTSDKSTQCTFWK